MVLCWKGWGRADILGRLQLWLGTFLLCCCHGRLRWSPYRRSILWFWSGWYWCYTASWLPTKLHAILCWTPSQSPKRYGKGFAGVAGISHRVFLDWKFAQLCSFLLRNLPVLLWWSPQLVASAYSGFLVWPYLADWSDWWYGSFGIVVGCLSLGEWWSKTESKVLATILSARSYCRWLVTYLSWPFLLSGPALMDCCPLLPTCLSSVILLRLQLLLTR